MNAFLQRRALVAGALIAFVASTNAQAATQGSLGSTSTGTVSISATVPAKVQISGLTDFAFGTLDPTTATSTAKNVCVWSNTATKGYNITATGSYTGSSGTAFKLSNGTTQLDYGVEWAASADQSTGTNLTANSVATGFTSTATTPSCASGASPTASLMVKFSTAQMQAAVGSATAYTGTLTLVVAPE
jgi:spore coat protein U-like protein